MIHIMMIAAATVLCVLCRRHLLRHRHQIVLLLLPFVKCSVVKSTVFVDSRCVLRINAVGYVWHHVLWKQKQRSDPSTSVRVVHQQDAFGDAQASSLGRSDANVEGNEEGLAHENGHANHHW